MLMPFTLDALEARRLFNGLPTIGVDDITVVEGNDGTRNAAVVVRLSGSRPKQTVTVNYATQNGSAVAGADYLTMSGKVSFAAAEVSKTILIPIKGDRLAEADEYLVVNLSGAKNAKVADAQGYVAIADDEARVAVTHDAAPVAEGNVGTTAVTFTVVLAAAYDSAVSVDYATADGSATTTDNDYAAAAGRLTFEPGQTSKQVTVLVTGDRRAEQDEYFYLRLSNPSGNASIDGGIALRNVHDDEPLISIADAWNYGEATPFAFTVSLSAASDQQVTVDFQTVDGTAVAGTDYVTAAGTLTFDPGETSKTILVMALDVTSAPDKYFYVILSGAANAPISYGTAAGYWCYDYGYYDGGGWYYDPGYYYY
jgi:hypothetical protein